MLTVGLTGFFTSLSLILAIGAQNTMLLRQGLTKQHIFWACIFCSVSDAILILFGIFGFDFAASKIPNLAFVLTIGGIIFLISYGSKRLWAAYIGSYEIEINGKSKSLSSVLASLAAVTWLNPHVYLDTMVLLGAISVQYNNLSEKIIFTLRRSGKATWLICNTSNSRAVKSSNPGYIAVNSSEMVLTKVMLTPSTTFSNNEECSPTHLVLAGTAPEQWRPERPAASLVPARPRG